MQNRSGTWLGAAALLLHGLCLALPVQAAREPELAGWSLQMDNDALAFTENDQGYSFGFGLVLAGDLARQQWFSLDPLLGHADRLAGWSDNGDPALHSIQIGLMAFTPADLRAERPLPGQTPYANLLFVSNARERVYPSQQRVDYSSLSIGVLGSAAGEHTQRAVHYLTNDKKPRGWDNQISDGGEPTFRYLLACQSLRAHGQLGGHRYEIKRVLRGSIGYFTEADLAYTVRYGRLRSGWWQHTPENVDYLPGPDYSGKISPDPDHTEFFVSTGLMLRLRAYNALLQGQFRDSAVEYDADELRHMIVETWLGVTREFAGGLQLSFTLRYNTREIRDSRRDAPPVWGSMSLSHGF